MELKDFQEEYERIIHSSQTSYQKDRALSELMDQMQRKYKIPLFQKPEWEAKNRKIIAMYRKISQSREFEDE